MTFDSLGLAPAYLRAVADEGYTEPTPVQRQAIPLVLAGRDLLAGAQTGHGQDRRLRPARSSSGCDATRPADAVGNAGPRTPGSPRVPRPGARPHAHPRARAPGGGERAHLRPPSTDALRRHLRRRRLRGPGPRPPRRHPDRRRHARAACSTTSSSGPSTSRGSRCSSSTRPTGCSTWASSATSGGSSPCSPASARTCCSPRPSRTRSGSWPRASSTTRRSVDVAPRNTAAELVEQVVIRVDRERKRELLVATRPAPAGSPRPSSSPGPSTARTASPSSSARDGIAAAAIHGNKSQGQRIRALDDFKAGRVGILVATDIAARGIDIESLPHVVNYELPMVAHDYVHRIGRTGRAGVGGEAISLVCVDEGELLRDIERLLRRPLPVRDRARLRAGPLDPSRAHRPPIQRSGASPATRGTAAAPAPARLPVPPAPGPAGGADRPRSSGLADRRPRTAPGPAIRRRIGPARRRTGTPTGAGRPARARRPPFRASASAAPRHPTTEPITMSPGRPGRGTDDQALPLRARTARRRNRAQ